MKKILFLVSSLLVGTSLVAADPSRGRISPSDWVEQTPAQMAEAEAQMAEAEAQMAEAEAVVARLGLKEVFDAVFGRGETPLGYIKQTRVLENTDGVPVTMGGEEVVATQYLPLSVRKVEAASPESLATLRSASSVSVSTTTPQAAVLSPVAFSPPASSSAESSFYYSERLLCDRLPRLVRGASRSNSNGYVSE